MGDGLTRTSLRIGVLGAMTVERDGVPVALPASRKVRALIAYLALATRAPTRTHLCELLGDIPNDPRSELRWCLSKVRSVLDTPGRARVETALDSVRLDLSECVVDALVVGDAMQSGVAALDAPRLRELYALFRGDFLDGMEIDRSPQLDGWIVAQRRRLRAAQVAILEHLVARLAPGSDEAMACLDDWLRLAPYDRRAHEALLHAFAAGRQLREGDAHVAETTRRFEAEGLDAHAIRQAWREAKGAAQAPVLPDARARDDVAASARPASAAAPTSRAEGAAVTALQIQPQPPAHLQPQRRASIAVMPFADPLAGAAPRGGIADALAHDVITRLAKLRTLFVIAQGTVFELHERRTAAGEVGRTLDVDYVVSGWLRRQGSRIVVNVELAETRSARIVWAETFEPAPDDTFALLEEIGNRIVASIAGEIELLERNRAILKPPSSLDAWEALHRGLWHMYRFDRAENERARHFFGLAVQLDPTFARAHAGLSFTHWQDAFQGWDDRDRAAARALETAGRSVVVDDRDPAAHWAMGRALWLRGQQDQAIVELENSVDLSPNFALGHYTLAFVHCQSGDPQAAIASADHSRHLSPFDPLLFGMLASKAMALVRLGRFDEAREWALKAAARPNAHAHIRSIAAHCLALDGRLDEARAFAASIRQSVPNYRADDFLGAFRFAPDVAGLFRTASRQIGID